jgi:hypothetical protein
MAMCVRTRARGRGRKFKAGLWRWVPRGMGAGANLRHRPTPERSAKDDVRGDGSRARGCSGAEDDDGGFGACVSGAEDVCETSV